MIVRVSEPLGLSDPDITNIHEENKPDQTWVHRQSTDEWFLVKVLAFEVTATHTVCTMEIPDDLPFEPVNETTVVEVLDAGSGA